MPVTTEIAPDLFRISVFVPEINLQFNHFRFAMTSHCCFIRASRHVPVVEEAVRNSSTRASAMDWVQPFRIRRVRRAHRWLDVAPLRSRFAAWWARWSA